MLRAALAGFTTVAVLLVLGGCDHHRGKSTSGNDAIGVVSAFAVEVSGQQTDSWTEHYKEASCGGTFTADGQGSETAQIASTGLSPLVVLRDDATAAAVTGDYLLPLHVELTRQGNETFGGSGPGCGGICHPGKSGPVDDLDQPCGPPPRDCGQKTHDLRVQLHYDGAAGTVALTLALDPNGANPDDGQWIRTYENCPNFGSGGLLGVSPDNSTSPNGPLPVADLLDSNNSTLTTSIGRTSEMTPSDSRASVTEKLTLQVKLHRVYKYARGKQYKFGSCAAAVKAISGVELGTTAWGIGFDPGSTQVSKQPDDSYQATVSAKLVRKRLDVITLPDWTNADAYASAWKAARDALDAHERGHVKVTDAFLEQHSAPETFVGRGDTPEQAVADAQQQLNAQQSSLGSDLKNQQDDYDLKTEHGVHQSRVGGVDAVLECPGQVPTDHVS